MDIVISVRRGSYSPDGKICPRSQLNDGKGQWPQVLRFLPHNPPQNGEAFHEVKPPPLFFFWWRMTLVFGCLKFLRLSCHYHWLGTGFIIKVEAHFRGWSLKEHSYHPEEFKNWVLRISEGTQHKKTMLKQQMQLYFLPGSVVSKGSVKEFKSKEFQGTREQNMWQNLPGTSGLSCSTLLTTDHVFKTCLLILKYVVESC